MTDAELLSVLVEQIGALAEGVQTVMEHQQALEAKLDAQTEEMERQAASLAAIAVAVGKTYLATGTDQPLPVEILEDRAFAQFVVDYPLDGPLITGKEAMEDHLTQLDKVDPEHLAAGFRDLATAPNLSPVERVRNRQIEWFARQRYGDLEALEKGRSILGTPSRENDR